MPLPAPRANYHAKQNVNGVLRRVYSDGSKYYDLSNAGAEITNWWLPGGAPFHIDFINNRGWWNGAAKTVSDLTAIGDGSYTLPWASIGVSWTGDLTVQLEYELTYGSDPTGPIFGWYNGGTQYRYFTFAGATLPDWRFYASMQGASPTVFSVAASEADAQSSGLMTFAGVNRSIFSMRSNSSEGRAIWGASKATNLTGSFGTIAAPTTLHFMRNPGNGTLTQNVTLRSVTIWPRALTETEMRKANDLGQARPLHLLTDSFGTHGKILMYLKQDLLEAAGDLISFSQDAVGSKNLEDHLARFLTTPYAWDSTLVIIDGSNEINGARSIAAIDAMAAKLTHTRLLYVEPNPIVPIGNAARPGWDADQAAILAHLGSTRYCATLAGMQAANDGTANDLADVTNGLWPRSLRGDSTHLDNSDGLPVFAGLIYDKLVANKWIPA